MAGLSNLGKDLGLIHDPIRRLIFCKTLDDSGSENVISLTDAVVLANWQTQFDQYSHLSDYSDRFVPTPKVRQVSKDDLEPEYWEVEDYKRKMRNGYADLNFSLLDPSPYILGNLAPWEDETLSVFMLSEDAKVIGILDGSNLKPLPIKDGSFSVPNWSPGGYDEGSTNVVTFRLDSATDLNSVVAITIASADATSDSDFYSLRDSSMVIDNEAVTGCTFAPTVDDVDPEAPGTSIPITGILHSEITFKDQATPFTEVTLAASGSLTYSGGVYTVNEAALLTTGHTYDLLIEHSGFDIIKQDVVVP